MAWGTDAERLADFVDNLQAIDMSADRAPLIEHFAEHTPEAAGYPLVQVIETSNITGHFCDLTGDAYIDVFSCKPFEPDIAVDLILERLGAGSVSRTVIIRQAAQPASPNVSPRRSLQGARTVERPATTARAEGDAGGSRGI